MAPASPHRRRSGRPLTTPPCTRNRRARYFEVCGDANLVSLCSRTLLRPSRSLSCPCRHLPCQSRSPSQCQSLRTSVSRPHACHPSPPLLLGIPRGQKACTRPRGMPRGREACTRPKGLHAAERLARGCSLSACTWLLSLGAARLPPPSPSRSHSAHVRCAQMVRRRKWKHQPLHGERVKE